MLRQARVKIVVADHRKLGAVATSLIWPPGGIDVLITDSGAGDDVIAPFVAMGIDVRRA